VEVEFEGAEKIRWSCKVCGKADYRPGEKVTLEVVEEKKHWFDAVTGKLLNTE